MKNNITIQELQRMLAKNSSSLVALTDAQRIDRLENTLSQFVEKHNGLCEDFNELQEKHNGLVSTFKDYIADTNNLLGLLKMEINMLFMMFEKGDTVIDDEDKDKKE